VTVLRCRAVAVLGAGVLLQSCVSERLDNKPRGVPVRRASGGTLVSPQAEQPSETAPPFTLPQGPIARPADQAQSSDARVRVAVKPLGVVPFDGMTLPVVSPDGRYLATQVGEAPSWPTVLAQAGATVPRCHVEVFDLTAAAPKRVELPSSLPPGLMLGRDADGSGVLVESQRPDGSRWIGKLAFGDGQLQWLAQGKAVNAHAALGPGGELIFTRRDIDQPESALVIRAAGASPSERVLATPKVSYWFPAFASRGADAVAFAIGPDGIEVQAFSVAGSADAATTPLRPHRARRLIGRTPDPMSAYQAASCVQPLAGGSSADGFLFHQPFMGRMCLLDPALGTLTPLAERSVSAVSTGDPSSPGFFLTTPRGLMFQRVSPSPDGPSAGPESRALTDSWVPRATSNPQMPFVLLGPGPHEQPLMLRVVAMAIATDEAPAATTKPQ